LLNVKPSDAPEAVEKLLADLKALRQELEAAKRAGVGNLAERLAGSAQTIGGQSVVITAPEGTTMSYICLVHPWMQGEIQVLRRNEH